jgi:hypothetical protein
LSIARNCNLEDVSTYDTQLRVSLCGKELTKFFAEGHKLVPLFCSSSVMRIISCSRKRYVSAIAAMLRSEE